MLSANNKTHFYENWKKKKKKNLKQSNQPPKRTRKRRTNKTIAEKSKAQQGNKIEFKKKH